MGEDGEDVAKNCLKCADLLKCTNGAHTSVLHRLPSESSVAVLDAPVLA